MSGFEKQQQQQQQQPQSPTGQQGLAPPAQVGIPRSSTIMTAGGSPSTASLHVGDKISQRRELYEYLIDTDHQLQLTLPQAQKAYEDLNKFDFSKHYSEDKPGAMIWYQDHLSDLFGKAQQLEWDLRTAKIRLELLIEVNVIREGLLQPKKYTTSQMESEVRQQQQKLAKIREYLDMAKAVFTKTFAKWLKKWKGLHWLLLSPHTSTF